MNCIFKCLMPLLPPETKLRKVMFSHACVKNSVHRRGACMAGGVRGWKKRQWQRAVCILLECIVVCFIVSDVHKSLCCNGGGPFRTSVIVGNRARDST